jgi:hypothetical protein
VSVRVRWIHCLMDVIALGLHYGPEPDFTRRIPGLKIETWGTRPISSKFSRTRTGFSPYLVIWFISR